MPLPPEPPSEHRQSGGELDLVLLTDQQVRDALGDEAAGRVTSFRERLGFETIRLTEIEFRIVTFLAARPYQAFTPSHIAEAVGTHDEPVTSDTLGLYIASLRQKLGLLSDYIQSVPHIGYRFKA